MITPNDIEEFVKYVNDTPFMYIFEISNKNNNYLINLDINDVVTMLNDYRNKIIKISYVGYIIDFEVNDELYEIMKTLFDLKLTLNS
jgi:hypothetical protein